MVMALTFYQGAGRRQVRQFGTVRLKALTLSCKCLPRAPWVKPKGCLFPARALLCQLLCLHARCGGLRDSDTITERADRVGLRFVLCVYRAAADGPVYPLTQQPLPLKAPNDMIRK